MASTSQGGKQGVANTLGGFQGFQQGSPNRGFVSLDPERQRWVGDEDGRPAVKTIKTPQSGGTATRTTDAKTSR